MSLHEFALGLQQPRRATAAKMDVDGNESEIAGYAERTMNELLGLFGYEKVGDEIRNHLQKRCAENRAGYLVKAEKQSAARLCHFCKKMPSVLNCVELDEGSLQFCSPQCVNLYKMEVFKRETLACLMDNASGAGSLPKNQDKKDKSSAEQPLPALIITPEAWVNQVDCKQHRQAAASSAAASTRCLTAGKRVQHKSPADSRPAVQLTLNGSKSRFYRRTNACSKQRRRGTFPRPHPYYALNKKYWQNRLQTRSESPKQSFEVNQQERACSVEKSLDEQRQPAVRECSFAWTTTAQNAQCSNSSSAFAAASHKSGGQIEPDNLLSCFNYNVLLAPCPLFVPIPIPVPIPLAIPAPLRQPGCRFCNPSSGGSSSGAEPQPATQDRLRMFSIDQLMHSARSDRSHSDGVESKTSSFFEQLD